MTCIVVVSDSRTVLLGGDSAAASDRGVFIRATRKVFRAGAYAIGFTGSWRMGQILRHETELPEPPDTRDGKNLRTPDYIEEGQEISGVFLVGVHGSSRYTTTTT